MAAKGIGIKDQLACERVMRYGINQSDYCGSLFGKTAIMGNYAQALGKMPKMRIYV